MTRWLQHVSMARCGPYNYPLHQAIREHGAGDFSIESLLCCISKADAYWAEGYLIEQYGTLAPNGYNQSRGPGRSRLSPPKVRPKLGSPELRLKQSEIARAFWLDPEWREREMKRRRELWADPKKRAAMTAHLAKRWHRKHRTIRERDGAALPRNR
jgi:hypothetical protein